MEISIRHQQSPKQGGNKCVKERALRLSGPLAHQIAGGALTSLAEYARAVSCSENHSSDGRRLLAPCEQLKFRMLAAAIFAEPGQFLQHALLDGKIEFGSLVQEPGHVRYAAAGESLVILLPDLSTEKACNEAATDLLSIFYGRPNGANLNWIVDFSAVQSRPKILFMGTLCSLRESLERNGVKLRFSWMRASLFPESFGRTMRRVFNLRKVGEYLVSQ